MEFQKQVADTLVDAMERIDQEEYNAALAEINGLIGSAPDQVDVRMIAEVKLIERLISYKKEQEEWESLKLTRQIYEYCEKNYATGYEAEETAADLPDRDVIWCCWLQGVEQAPAVVKKCIRSFSKFEKKIHVITAENYAEYVSLPDCIVRKWEEGIISNTHFSDLLRIALLAERGGLWIDATVFCSDTREITEILNGTDLFAYSFAMRVDPTKHILFDSWFLYAAKKNPIIEETRQMLWSYWENEDCLMHYFLFHLCFASCCRRHQEAWEQIPVYSMEPCHILQQEMLGEYKEKRWNQIMKMSGIHKLTYKYDQELDIRGSMLEYLLGNETV